MKQSVQYLMLSFQCVAVALLAFCSSAPASDFSTLCADRAAIERVYYAHRIGTKQTFEEAMPRALIEQLARQEQNKETALRKVYGVEITPALLAAEVERINTTTRAPEVIAEIKHALGDDAARFAHSFARPILVERLLREKFDNDDTLHAPQRRAVEQMRNELLAAKQTGDSAEKVLAFLKRSHANAVTETTWQLGARPEEKPSTETADAIEIKKRFGPDAQVLSPPQASDGKERKFYFADLPGELQNVLRVQLRQAGDVSAVIEMPTGFLLYVAKEKTDAVLSVAGLSLPKRSYEQWLEEQAKGEE